MGASVRITFKAGGGYQDPWIVVEADGPERDEQGILVLNDDGTIRTAADVVSQEIEKLREMGAFSAVKLVAEEFRNAPAAGVEAVLAVIPGATEVSTSANSASGVAAPSAPPVQSTPVCTKCGAPTKFKDGVSAKSGAFKGFACTADRSHFDRQN